MAKITDSASELYLELDEPSSISIASISQWLRVNGSKLNNLINQDFAVDSTTYELVGNDGEITDEQMTILKQLYRIHYFLRESRTYLGAGGVESVQVVQQDGISVRTISRTDISRQYIELYKQAKEELKQLLNSYKYGKATPRQIVGDDVLTKNSPYTVDPLNNATLSS